jgi:hypothetical protein
MNGSVIREPSRSLKEQFSRSSEAWKEHSDPKVMCAIEDRKRVMVRVTLGIILRDSLIDYFA